MQHLKTISVVMTLAGSAAVIAAIALDLNATVTVVGMMLVVAGLVKVAMVGLWRTVAGFGGPVQADGPATNGTSEERRR